MRLSRLGFDPYLTRDPDTPLSPAMMREMYFRSITSFNVSSIQRRWAIIYAKAGFHYWYGRKLECEYCAVTIEADLFLRPKDLPYLHEQRCSLRVSTIFSSCYCYYYYR